MTTTCLLHRASDCAKCCGVPELTGDFPSGEFVLCDVCGQHVLRREAHAALCGLFCVGGKVWLEDEVFHDQDCPRCS